VGCGWLFVCLCTQNRFSNYNGRAFGVRMNCRRALLPVSGGKCGRRGISDRADAGFHGEERGPDAKSPFDRQQLGSARDGGCCQPHKCRTSAKNHRWALQFYCHSVAVSWNERTSLCIFVALISSTHGQVFNLDKDTIFYFPPTMQD